MCNQPPIPTQKSICVQGGAVCMRRLINAQVGHIISLMQSGIDVAIVTAAGYPGQPEKFEERVAGLLAAFRRLRLPSEITDRHVLSYFQSLCRHQEQAVDGCRW